MGRREQHHNASGTVEWKLYGWKKRTEKIMTTLTTNEFGKHPCKKVRAELLENQQWKDMILMGLWRHLKTWGEILPLTKTIACLRATKRWKLLHRDEKEKIGSLMSTTIATFLREGFRWNITQDNSNEEMMGLNISFLITYESWNMKKIIKNDITPPQKIREKELHFGMQEEKYLSSSNKNLENTSRMN